jgi:hypothetical protein
MIERSLVERANTSDFVEQSSTSANGPLIDPSPFAEQAPLNAAQIHESSGSEWTRNETPSSPQAGALAALLTREVSDPMRTRWNEIQRTFVDDPRSAVQQADALVSDVVGQIAQMFATERTLLESQWKQGKDVSTEDLRKTLQRYRTFFNRLVV